MTTEPEQSRDSNGISKLPQTSNIADFTRYYKVLKVVQRSHYNP